MPYYDRDFRMTLAMPTMAFDAKRIDCVVCGATEGQQCFRQSSVAVRYILSQGNHSMRDAQSAIFGPNHIERARASRWQQMMEL